ncbi:MAG: hypothetical protein ABI889_15525, partial [Gemmatimonadota bacterium]
TPVPDNDSSATSVQPRGTPLGADVTMIRRVGGTFSGLRLLVNGEDSIKMAEPTARDFIAILDSAARLTAELSVPPPTIMASMPMQIGAPSGAPLPTMMARAATPASAPAPTPVPTRVSTRVSTRVVVPAPLPAPASVATVSRVAPVTTMGPSAAEASPELVLPAPSAPVVTVSKPPDAVRVKAPLVVAPRPTPVAAPASPAPAPPAPAPPAPAPPAPPAPAPPTPPTPPTPPARDTVVAPHPDAPSDKLIRTPLGPFTIPGALLSDRDKQAQYCYTQLGLKYSPDLKGEITVRLSLGSDGAVQEAVVTRRTWQGISAGEVESCVRALAHDWTFASSDAPSADGSKLLTFSFTP